MALLETISGPFSKALVVNHAAYPFDTVTPFASEPLQTTASTADDDGVINLAVNRSVTCNWLLIVPYAEGNPGEQFSMRLWGLRRFGNDTGIDRVIWLNYLIGEYLCTICEQPGPVYNLSNNPPVQPLGKFLLPSERLCDTISLTHGVPGLTSIIVSPASDVVPGSNLTACVLQEMFGSQKVYFDFQPEGGFAGGMNAAWAKA